MTQPAPPARAPLSVVVPTRDRPDRLAGCLALLRDSVGSDDELLVVDSASTSDSSREVARKFGVGYVRVDVPGTSRARNVGWRTARHDCIAFVDDDVRVAADWAEQMAQTLSDPDVFYATGWIGVYGDDQQDPQPLMVEPLPRRLDINARGAFGASANVGVNRAALERVGGFDERIGPGTWFAAGEDADLFDRLALAGLTGQYSPDIRVDHDHVRTRGERLRLHWCYGKGSGARLRMLVQRDRQRAVREARELLWRRGIVQALTRVRQRWATGAACSALRVLGAVVAFVRAWRPLRPLWPDR
jgi:GT2 family glycosyltransferase